MTTVLDWSTVSIIAGGPSAAGIKRSDLPGIVLAINETVFAIEADAFFSLDHRATIIQQRSRIMRCGVPVMHVAVKPQHMSMIAELYHGRATVWPRSFDEVPDTASGVITGGPPGASNSGAGAICLAVMMGARRVALYGYDMEPAYGYWYDQDPSVKPPRDDERDGILAHFERLGAWCAAHHVEVRNMNPDSHVRGFLSASSMEGA